MPTKDVNKLLKGANDCVLAAVDDAGSASPAQCGDSFPLLSLGYMDENSIQSESKKLTQKAQGGESLQLGEIASVNINSLSGAGLAISSAKKFKNAQCNIYGFGSQQSHKLTRFLMNVETPNDLKKDGKSVIQFSTEKKVSPDENLGTLGSAPAAFAADAAYRFNEIMKNIRQENLVLAAYPYLGNFGQTAKLYDASDNRIVASLVNGPTWGAAPSATYSKLAFDGVNDYLDFGDILDDDGVSDVLFEIWVNPVASMNFGKRNNSGTGVGFSFLMIGSNQFTARFHDGTNSQAITSAASFTTNTWYHIALAIDRNGNAQIYVNGVASGSPGSLASIGSMANSISLLIGKFNDGSPFYQSELGAFRVYNFGAGGLPSNIATILLNHYNSEKSIFGFS